MSRQDSSDIGDTELVRRETANTGSVNPQAFPDIIEIKTRGKQPEEQKMSFESDEHRDIGNFAFNRFMNDLTEQDPDLHKLIGSMLVTDENAASIYNPYYSDRPDSDHPEIIKIVLQRFQINENLKLSPGHVVALAGDFFAALDPIAFGKTNDEKTERFEAAFKTLCESTESTTTIERIVAHIEDESEGSSPHAHWGMRFVKEIKQRAKNALDFNNIRYIFEMMPEKNASGLKKLLGKAAFWHSPYYRLALMNFDHFGEEAKVAYLTGHLAAIKMAQEAGDQIRRGEHKKGKESIKGALLRELYACHYLTDLFAAGHIRTPRKQLLNHLMQGGSGEIDGIPDLAKTTDLDLLIAGFFARKMHDEDGDKGLFVKFKDQKDAKAWKAFGDGNFYNKENQKSAKHVCKVVQMALWDLVFAYHKEEKELKLNSEDKLATHIPWAFPAVEKYKNQLKPLFYTEGRKLRCRDNNIFSPMTFGLTAVSLFNVSVKPAAGKASAQTVELARKVKAKTGELAEQTKEQVQALYDRARAVECKIQ